MTGLGELEVFWKKKVGSGVIWLQQAESINHECLPEVTDKALEKRDRTWLINASTLATIRAENWDGFLVKDSSVEEPDEAIVIAFWKGARDWFLFWSL
jgi:hypothetical protein